MKKINKEQEQTNVRFLQGNVFQIKKDNKYIVIFPANANIDKVAPALAEFCKPTKVFILCANDITDIKLAELVES